MQREQSHVRLKLWQVGQAAGNSTGDPGAIRLPHFVELVDGELTIHEVELESSTDWASNQGKDSELVEVIKLEVDNELREEAWSSGIDDQQWVYQRGEFFLSDWTRKPPDKLPVQQALASRPNQLELQENRSQAHGHTSPQNQSA
jgi:hypothetical protein